MSSPTVRATNEWRVNGGDDILQIQSVSGTVVCGINSAGAGFGALASGGTPGGINTQIQFNNNGVFGGSNVLTFDSAVNQLKFQAPAVGAATAGFSVGSNSIGVTSGIIQLLAVEPSAAVLIGAYSGVTIASGVGAASDFNLSSTASINLTAGVDIVLGASRNISGVVSGSVIFDTTNGNPGTTDISLLSGDNINIIASQSGTARVTLRGAKAITFFLGSVAVFANNAAAITGGLTAGDVYRTGANPDPLCIVH